MKKLEHVNNFDESIYKDAGTTAVREYHTYVDCVRTDVISEFQHYDGDMSAYKENLIKMNFCCQ